MAERRVAHEFRVQGRTLAGAALVYGDVSPDYRERFVPGALRHGGRVDVNLQHDPSVVLARNAILSDRPRALEVRAELPADSAALALVRRGALNAFSIEFRALRESREGDVRVIQDAELTGLALVDRGAYPQSVAEVRARRGRTLRQRIPGKRNVECRCSGPGCRFARFMQEAMQDAFDVNWNKATSEILAVRNGYAGPLASKSAGTLRASLDGDDAIVEVDLPTGPDGDAVLRAIEDTGAVIARPFLDTDASDGTIESLRAAGGEGYTMVYRRAVVRSIVVGATDAREGWPVPELVPTPGMDRERSAPEPRRRRVWL